MEANLDDILTQAEGRLERRLAAVAMFQPKVIAQLDYLPEIDLSAKSFFQKFNSRRADILNASELQAIQLAYACCGYDGDWYHADFWKFFGALGDTNTFQYAQEIGRDLAALKTVRKSVRWIETSGLLEGAAYG